MSDIVDNALSLLEHYATAIRSGDAGALDALLSPGFRFVSALGTVMDRASRIAALTAAATQLSAFTFEVVLVQRASDDALIVTSGFTAEFRSGAEPAHGVASLVFGRRADRWRLIHQHDSQQADRDRL
jgi:ketosteroid isomerase-like protein